MKGGTAVGDLPERPVEPEWLALREPADARARQAGAATLLTPLLSHLAGRPYAGPGRPSPDGAGRGVRVVDLGAGTGANLRWLAPRLSVLREGALEAQHWTLVDHDPRLCSWGPASSTTVRADVADLPRLLTQLDGVDLVTAAALLDLLDGPTLAAVVDATVAHGVPTLLALSVTGSVHLDPSHPADGAVRAAFDAHQRRDGRLGPDAPTEAVRRYRDRGWTVVEAPTAWRLGAHDTDLVLAWLEGRVEAAVEWQPSLDDRARAWLERRRAQALAGLLSVVVDHVDVLALPDLGTASPTARTPRRPST